METPNQERLARGSWVAAAVLALLAALNAWQYSAAAAGPLVQADSWYFLDVFLSKYFDGTLQALDLFVQRGGDDHSQPLHKLILLFHTRYFDMDFRIEGLVGTAIGIAWCALLASGVWKNETAHGPRQPATALMLALIFVLGLSLNASNIFTWSLVTLVYLTLFIATIYFLTAQRLIDRSHQLLLAPATFLLGITTDEVGIIVFMATLVTLGLFSTAPRRKRLLAVTASLAGLIVARAFIWMVSARGLASTSDSTPSMVDVLFTTEAMRGIFIPFADSLLHYEHVLRHFPDNTGLALTILTAFVVLLHIYFWVVVVTEIGSGRRERTVGLAVFLMLMSYALTVGIVVGRVPVFGWSYLHQPRYVLFYQVSLVAIAILFTHRVGRRPASASARSRWGSHAESAFIASATAMLLMVQVSVSRDNWQSPRYLTPYWQNAALAMQALAEDPAHPPVCPDIMSVCDYTLESREKLMSLLVTRQLNIFSPGFQMRNRIYPSLQSIPGFEHAELKNPAITEE